MILIRIYLFCSKLLIFESLILYIFPPLSPPIEPFNAFVRPRRDPLQTIIHIPTLPAPESSSVLTNLPQPAVTSESLLPHSILRRSSRCCVHRHHHHGGQCRTPIQPPNGGPSSSSSTSAGGGGGLVPPSPLIHSALSNPSGGGRPPTHHHHHYAMPLDLSVPQMTPELPPPPRLTFLPRVISC